MIDDRDKQLLQFLKDNAGRPYTVKLLCAKFGYKSNGSGVSLRKKLNYFVGEGYPVRRITAGKLSGAMWCIESNQMFHYASKLEERAKAILVFASQCRTAAQKIQKKEMIEVQQ